MAVADPSTQLSCGRDIDQVWDRLDRAPDAHEIGCVYCQAARADLAQLATATRRMREEDAAAPDREPGPEVLERILTVARAEVRRGRRLPLDRPTLDQTSTNTVSEQAVTAVIRRTGDRLRQIQIRRCSIVALDPDPVAHEAADRAGSESARPPLGAGGESVPASVAVALTISVGRDLSIVESSNRLRAAVIDAVLQEVGIRVHTVNIVVEDLNDD